jgi:NADPH:quinone reductase
MVHTLSLEEQADDIRSAFALAGAWPSFYKTSGIYGLDEIRDAVTAVEAPGRDGFVFIRP